ncbi:AbrB/MazE/SpoVT family DNA-binding domain-containing protein [Archaeoglobales archaeon]|nr:MAG: AbrB/MazE/SpoVT family DNA-binding domain-containing protein [Archaeoglobales archaeon]
MNKSLEIIREVDKQGRLVLPKEWREKIIKGNKVLLRLKEDSIEIIPVKRPDLTKYFDSIEMDIRTDLSDWKSLKRELHEIR